MTKPSHLFAFLALALWLLGNWMGAHSHFCFDGQEPPVSVHMHMHMLGEHPEHHGDEEHQDADVDLLQSVLAKLTKLDQGLLLLALVLLLLPRQTRPHLRGRYRPFAPAITPFVRPRLRAPPFTA